MRNALKLTTPQPIARSSSSANSTLRVKLVWDSIFKPETAQAMVYYGPGPAGK